MNDNFSYDDIADTMNLVEGENKNIDSTFKNTPVKTSNDISSVDNINIIDSNISTSDEEEKPSLIDFMEEDSVVEDNNDNKDKNSSIFKKQSQENEKDDSIFKKQPQEDDSIFKKPPQEDEKDDDSNNSSGNVFSLKCRDCGTIFTHTNNSRMSKCVYCGSSYLDKKVVDLSNYFIIPFNYSKQDAISAYKKKILNPMVPFAFKKKNVIMSIQGVYLPSFLIDFNVSGKIGFFTADNAKVKGGYEIDKHYCLYSTNFDFKDVCVNRFSKIDDEVFSTYCKYDYSKMSSYDPGFQNLGDEHIIYGDLMQDDVIKKMNSNVFKYMTKEVRSAIKYESTKFDKHNFETKYLAAKNLLVPIYFLNVKYKNKDYKFIMNAQNGNVYFDSVHSIVSLVIMSILVFALVLLIAFLIVIYL